MISKDKSEFKNSITKNTIYNLLGFSLPLLFAVIFIPTIINKLGTERFGLLTLVWVVVGYFSFFDLGIGRALTKIISEKIGLKLTDQIPSFFWTSLIITFLMSSLFPSILFFFTDELVNKFLKISTEYRNEAKLSFQLLLIILPFVATTAVLRGVLESYQRFGTINIIRLLLGISNFLIPMVVVQFSYNLYHVVIYLVIFRLIVWVMFFISVLRVSDGIKTINLKIRFIIPVVKLSSWMTISNLTIPVMVYLDRILIGALISAEAITYYATPYEVVSKLWIIPAAVTGVLFPNFSMKYVTDKNYAISLLSKSTKYVSLFLLPVIIALIVFSDNILTIWLGKEFSEKSFVVMRLILIGVFFNCIAQILFSFIEGIGKPDITAKLQLIELPFYVGILYYSTYYYGIIGAASIFMLRMLADYILLSIIVKKVTNVKSSFTFQRNHLILLLIILILTSTIFIKIIFLKIMFSIIVLTILIYYIWKTFIENEEKARFATELKSIIRMKKKNLYE